MDSGSALKNLQPKNGSLVVGFCAALVAPLCSTGRMDSMDRRTEERMVQQQQHIQAKCLVRKRGY